MHFCIRTSEIVVVFRFEMNGSKRSGIFILLLSTLLCQAKAYDDGLDNLGARISAEVRRNLAPLNDLGARINEQVQRQVAPLNDLGARINEQVQRQVAPLNDLGARINEQVQRQVQPHQNLGAQISSNVNAQLAPLNNLGSQISNSVHQALEPVRALEIMNKMKQGVGGTTIITYKPGGQQLLIENYQLYECQDGEITTNGKCEGKLKLFEYKEKSDFCYLNQPYSIINDQICIGADNVYVINNKISCTSSTNRPVLLMSKRDYNELCKDISMSTEYKYISNVNDPNHIKIPNANKYVRCKNNEENVCIFDGNNINNNNNNQVYYNTQIHSY